MWMPIVLIVKKADSTVEATDLAEMAFDELVDERTFDYIEREGGALPADSIHSVRQVENAWDETFEQFQATVEKAREALNGIDAGDATGLMKSNSARNELYKLGMSGGEMQYLYTDEPEPARTLEDYERFRDYMESDRAYVVSARAHY